MIQFAPHQFTTVVGVFNPLERYVRKLDHFPKDRGENKTHLSCHHLV